METSLDLYDFDLPEAQIAAYPAAVRGDDRLLVLDRNSRETQHRHFSDLGSFLRRGDLLVFNNIRVRKARLDAVKDSGGRVELLLLQPRSADLWECLTKSARPVRPGTELTVAGRIRAAVVSKEEGFVAVRFAEPLTEELIEEIGTVPLPPYIVRRRAELSDGVQATLDEIRYQTVFAQRTGAVAAPTAGLHFTPELLEQLTEQGVQLAWISLEVGWGTFAPVKDDDIRAHRMHQERYSVPGETAAAVARTRTAGGRVIAVGTTVVRTLESAVGTDGSVAAGEGSTEIFIYPGYSFRAVDGMVTNFHTPRSTLLMMISAFAGRERIMEVYREAVAGGYRFFSYGDAMLLI